MKRRNGWDDGAADAMPLVFVSRILCAQNYKWNVLIFQTTEYNVSVLCVRQMAEGYIYNEWQAV